MCRFVFAEKTNTINAEPNKSGGRQLSISVEYEMPNATEDDGYINCNNMCCSVSYTPVVLRFIALGLILWKAQRVLRNHMFVLLEWRVIVHRNQHTRSNLSCGSHRANKSNLARLSGTYVGARRSPPARQLTMFAKVMLLYTIRCLLST